MAKSMDAGQIIIYGGLAYLVYKSGILGKLGVNLGSLGGGGGGGGGGGTTPGGGGCALAFDGQNYVGQDGTYYVIVVGGAEVGRYSNQATAEGWYNHIRCPSQYAEPTGLPYWDT